MKTALKRALLWLWKVLPLGRRPQFTAMWLLNTKFLVGVVGVVLDDDGRVLLVEHAYRNEFPWGLPSGWAKCGEQPQAAIRREILEEAGLAVEVVSVLEVSADPDLPRVDLVFQCRPAPGAPSSDASRASGRAGRRRRSADYEVVASAFFPAAAPPARLLRRHEELIRLALAHSPADRPSHRR